MLDGVNFFAYAGDTPAHYTDPWGLKAEVDWQKILNCIHKCGKDCLHEKEFDKCYLPCVGKCIGKELLNGNCGGILCWLANQPWFPKQIGDAIRMQCHQNTKDPCEYKDVHNCQNCCGLKHYCCMMTNCRQGG